MMPKCRLSLSAALVLACLGGCASLPPGSSYPKVRSATLPDPQTTRFGRQFASAAQQNAGRSGFHIFNAGIDGFLMRLEMINAAERTLDLQYYIFRGDDSGRVITEALVRAADRGVRVRVLVDEGEKIRGDEQLFALSGHAAIEIRVFNPWAYRGNSKVLRAAEYLVRHSRLDYRMHNKLLVADGAVALLGGRNIGNQYFQIDPESQFADDDVFSTGPIMKELSSEFDEYWNSALAIPVEALAHHHAKNAAASSSAGQSPPAPLKVPPPQPGSVQPGILRPVVEPANPQPEPLQAASLQKAKSAGLNYEEKLATGEPLAGIMSGALPLVWADAQFVADPPDKKARKSLAAGSRVGDLMYKPVAEMARRVNTELLVVTPYFVPTKDELQVLKSRREQGAHIRVLTNSLQSNPDAVAHAGYTHYRPGLLKEGVQLHEVRALLGNTRGSGQSRQLSRYGNYALHAKFYVMDRKELFIGSMNFDVRSRRLNTEMGLIIRNSELAQQEAAHFEAMTRPENVYSVELRSDGGLNSSRLVWHTTVDGKSVEYEREPARSGWQRTKVRLLSLLPLDSEL